MPTFAEFAAEPQPSQFWVEYFRANAERPPVLPPGPFPTLSPWERRCIAASIGEFQLGESSEGRHLKQLARNWCQEAGDPHYADAIDLFIGEENRHARDLGQFMDVEGIGRLGQSLSDRVFRRLRKLGGLELAVRVLVSAEIIAQVYYQALRDATHSRPLHALCERILEDEELHVRYQSERLAILRRGRRGQATIEAMHWILLGGAALVVWINHRPVLRSGGFGLVTYLREVAGFGVAAMRRADPATYGWGGVSDAAGAATAEA